MRELADDERIRRFMRAIGGAAASAGTAYFTGGATAVLLGWRSTTIDVDVVFVPEQDSIYNALPSIKEQLSVNVELASPAHFIPVPAGWEERSLSVGMEGRLSFAHFDLYAQALAKLERAHRQDLEDVDAMLELGLVESTRALELFAEIEPELRRFPAVDPRAFRRRVERAFAQ